MGKPALNVVDQAESPPTLESISERYAKVVALQRQLHARLMDCESEVKALAVALSNVPPPLPSSNSPMRTVTIEPSAAAKRLLGDLSPEPRVETINGGSPLRRRADELSSEIEAIREAQAALEPEIRRARHEASAALCDLMRPAYKRVSQRLLAAMVELADAKVDHIEFLKAIERRGATVSPLRPVDGFELIGDPRDAGSPIRLSLNLAVQQGWADPAIGARWKGNK